MLVISQLAGGAMARAQINLNPDAVTSPAELREVRDALAAELDADDRDTTRAAAGLDERPRAHYALGVLELTLGLPDEALRQAEWIEREARRAPHLWEGAFAPALRARVLARRGDRAAAAAHYAMVATRWSEADAELAPLVAPARARAGDQR